MRLEKAVARDLGAPWVELSYEGLHLLCREDLRDDLLAMYGRTNWVYDALSMRPHTLFLRGRRPVVTGTFGGHDVVVKRMYHGGLLGGIRGDAFLTSHRARAHVALEAYLTGHGVATAPALFVAWRRVKGFIRAEVGFERIVGAVDADHYFFDRETLPHGWEERASAIGQVVARLHGIGFLHADLNLMNFLFGPDGRIYVLDLDKSTVLPHDCSRADRSRNLRRLQRSILKQGRRHLISQVERLIGAVKTSYHHASRGVATVGASVLTADVVSATQDLHIR